MFGRRSLLTTTLCMMGTCIPCLGQTSVSFSSDSTNAGPGAANVYAADLNQDGLTDVIHDVNNGMAGFTVSLSKGDGTFTAPVTYVLPGAGATPDAAPLAFGDFNGDGKIDVIVPAPGGTQMLVYLGKGDGTFQTPVTASLGLPDKTSIQNVPMAVADFNHDGRMDAAVVTVDSSNMADVYILEGNGAGGFTARGPVFTFALDAQHLSAVSQMAAGDFDSDNNADLALVTNEACDPGPTTCNYVPHVLYGDGQLNFTDEDPDSFSTSTGYELLVADINGDGRSDLIGYNPDSGQLVTFYGETGRQFTVTYWPVDSPPASGGPSNRPPFVMADFNGDGYMDLMMQTAGSAGSPVQDEFMLGSASPGRFTTQMVPAANYGFTTNPVVGDFNGDGKPDFAGVNGNGTTATPPALVAAVNSTSGGGLWANCAYPIAGPGITDCGPVQVGGMPVNFNAAASSFGHLRKIELWVDGNKLGEQHHTWGGDGDGRAWFALNQTLNVGTHSGAWVATDIDNHAQTYNFTFTVGPSPCPMPQGSGVNLCTPGNGATVSSPLLVQATARISNLARMEVWVDNAKKYTETPNNSISTQIPMRPGTHQVAVYGVDTGGNWSATIATVNVQ